VGALTSAHIFGTLVPVEEPSTASEADIAWSNHLGMPLREGLNFVHNALSTSTPAIASIGASGKIISAFDIARGRNFMFALKCAASSCRPGFWRLQNLRPRPRLIHIFSLS
jgi:hypothetical protein